MVSFTVRMEFEVGDRDAVAEMLHYLGAASREEPGCINYIAHCVEGEPATVLIYEQYVDEVAVEFHRAAPHFAQYADALYKIMLSRVVEHLEAVD
jgi:quinol monooxygenase YgiN